MPSRFFNNFFRDPWTRGLTVAAGLHGLGLVLLAVVTLAPIDSGNSAIGFTVEVNMAARFAPEPPAVPEIRFAPQETHALVTPEMAMLHDRTFQQMSTAELFDAPERTPEPVTFTEIESAARPRAMGNGEPSLSTSTASTAAAPSKQTFAAEQMPRHHTRGSDVVLPQATARGGQQLGNEETPANFAGNSPAIYPAEAKRRSLQGTVFLKLHVSERGDVERVEVLRSSGHSILDGAAVTMARRWQGQPRTRGGRPVASIETIPIHFRLQ